MKLKLFKKLFCMAMAIAVILLGCNINATSVVYAENSVDYLNYVSFGDSITTGYGLDGYGSDFVNGSYEALFKSYLQTNVGDINASSYAVDGYNSTKLLNMLKSNTEARVSVQNADVITVSIGGNDLLEAAQNFAIECFIQGSYEPLKQAMNAAVSNFETIFAQILAEFANINPDAKIIFTNVYNPYAALKRATHDVTLHVTQVEIFGETDVIISASSMREFGEVTEDYIAGDSNNGIVGINQIMQEQISMATNCFYVDTKNAFDNYSGEYTDITCASLTTYETIELTYYDIYTNNKLFDYLDPHPTTLGHEILAREFQTCFAENLAIIKFDYMGGNLDGVVDNKLITLKNKILSQPKSPILEHHHFLGWSTSLNNFELFDFSSDIVSNLTLYATWSAISFTVKFDYNGGRVGDDTFAEITLTEGMTVVEPSGDKVPVLEKFAFVGWYIDSECQQEFDFSKQIIQDTIIYAKWEQVQFDVTFNYTEGELNGDKSVTYIVDKNSLLTKPEGENLPIFMDHALVGWYKESSLNTEWNFESDVVTSDITLYAKWERTVWYVTLNYNGGTANNSSGQVIKVNKGEKLLKPDVQNLEKDGDVFMYWYLTDENIAFDFANYILESDITLYAYWHEGIVIRIYYGDISDTKNVAKGTTVGELEIPKRDGTVFYGWFKNATLSKDAEFKSDEVLEYGQTLYIKWMTLKCIDETLLIQEYSPLSKDITWHIDARIQNKVSWQVNGQSVEGGTVIVLDDSVGAYWDFKPADYGVGNYVITCLVNGSVVNGKTIQIKYSIPSDVLINLESVVDKKTYILEVDNQQYYDSSKFVWYKTSDPYTDDFSEEIGRGFELEYTFDNDCKIRVVYFENEGDEGIISNIIDVSVDNYIDNITLMAILITVFIIAIIVISAVISYRKNKGMY